MFSSSVPNTYAAILASMSIGWGGAKTNPPRDWSRRRINNCECGRIKLKCEIACDRCAEIDVIGARGPAWLLIVLSDYEPMTLKEISEQAQRTTRSVLRSIKPLVASGRVRAWIEPDHEGTMIERRGAYGAHFDKVYRYRAPNQGAKLYRRAW